MNTPDPLEHIERLIAEMHGMLHKGVKPVHKRYPLIFLFLATVSVAALFHGLDTYFTSISFFEADPLVLVGLGLIGLFITGSLYKRLGIDTFD